MRRFASAAAGCIFVFFLFIVTAGEVDAGRGERHKIERAKLVDEKVRPANSRVNEGKARNVSAMPENPESIPPIPLPMFKGPRPVPPAQNRPVSFDKSTGRETKYKRRPLPGNIPPKKTFSKSSSGVRAYSGDGDIQPLSMNSLARVPDPAEFPWSATVKIFMDFNGNQYVGSGILIDPFHVLTVGHVIHDQVDGWADEVVVVPGYDDGEAPFGDAQSAASGLYSWSGWIVDESFDHDMGIIKLDRPIGALSGWNTFAYDNYDTFFLDQVFNIPGYPAAPPYGWPGSYMYNWNGSFDEIQQYILYFDNEAYGGQSGSGVWHDDVPETKTVYGSLSHGWDDPIGKTGCTRITAAKFQDISDFISSNTPSSVDLIPLDVRLTPANIIEGEQFSSMSFAVLNYSTAAFQDSVTVEVYLSTDYNISGADTLLQTHEVALDLGPSQFQLVSVQTPPTVPMGYQTGDAYIGVILDIIDDNTANNESDGQDAGLITVFRLEEAPPPIPENLLAERYSGSTDVTFTWDVSAGADGYKIFYDEDPTNPPFSPAVDGVPASGADVGDTTSVTITGLDVNSRYYFGVRAYNIFGESDISPQALLQAAPDVPTGLNAETGFDTVSGSIILTWNASEWATGYTIFYDEDYNNPPFDPVIDGIPSSGTDVSDTRVVITGLAPSQFYALSVKAFNSYGASDYSSLVFAIASPLPPPSGLDAQTGLNSGEIIVSWNPTFGADGYLLFYDDDPLFPEFDPVPQGTPESGSDVGDSTSLTVSGLIPDQLYYISVKAKNQHGESDYAPADSVQARGAQDNYEPDNDHTQANPIVSGIAQAHDIVPIGDVDWVTFTLSQQSEVIIETSGPEGDSRLYLYDSSLTFIEDDDDGGPGLFSRIERLENKDPLSAGTYFVKVDEYGNDEEIPSYSLTLSVRGLGGGPLVPPVITDIRMNGSDSVTLYIESTANMQVTLLGSDDVEAWEALATDIPLVVGNNEHTFTDAGVDSKPKRFYKLMLSL